MLEICDLASDTESQDKIVIPKARAWVSWHSVEKDRIKERPTSAVTSSLHMFVKCSSIIIGWVVHWYAWKKMWKFVCRIQQWYQNRQWWKKYVFVSNYKPVDAFPREPSPAACSFASSFAIRILILSQLVANIVSLTWLAYSWHWGLSSCVLALVESYFSS